MSDKPTQAGQELTEDSYEEGEMLEEVANVIVNGHVKYDSHFLSFNF